MTTMQALVLDASAKNGRLQTRPIPEPREGEVLVRVHAVVLNPIDALTMYRPMASSGRVVGSDFAGVVVAASRNDTRVKEGQHVAGFMQGASSGSGRPGAFEQYGAFAQYVACPVDLLWHVPDKMPLEEAATISLCAMTAAQALYYRLGLMAPFDWEVNKKQQQEQPATVLIYGASTSVGMFAAQLVRHSGRVSGKPIRMIGAASRARFDMLRKEPYAYDALVDYRDEDWPEQVRQQAQPGSGGIEAAFNCISEGTTVRQICEVLRQGGRQAILRSKASGAWDKTGFSQHLQEPIYGAVWEALGEEIEYNKAILPASPEARSFAESFYRWLSSGPMLQPNPVRLMPGGLQRVAEDGLALLGSGPLTGRSKKVAEEAWGKPISAEKLVYKLET